jgi:hypothetical protein
MLQATWGRAFFFLFAIPHFIFAKGNPNPLKIFPYEI